MNRASLFAAGTLLCVLVVSFSAISPVKAAPMFATVGVPNLVKDLDAELVYVWGEVENVGDTPADSVRVVAEFTEYEGFPIAVGGAFTMLPVIHPGEISPFEIVYSGPEFDDIADANYDFEFSPAAALPTGLEIVSNSSDTPGTVVGEIQNTGTAPTTQITVAASFYKSGGLVAATASSSIAGPLDPGENATFTITLEHPVSEIEGYAVTAQSQDYAIIPEFPILTSMLLTLIILTVAIAIYKQRLLKTQIH